MFVLVAWLGFVDTIEQTGVPFLVVFQTRRTSNTSNSRSFPACNVLVWVVWVSNVSTEVWSTVGAFVWAFKGGGWMPFLSGDTVIKFVVEALVA